MDRRVRREGDYAVVPTSHEEAETRSSNQVHGFKSDDNSIELASTPTSISNSFSSAPVTYSWENITVYLETNPGNAITRLCKKSPPVQRKILDNVSGIVRPGECLAVMGASGAGKTTLLNCLTFRGSSKMLKTVGQRYLNGQLTNTDTLARVSGYVQQDDLFVPSLTVWEHLRFQALLRMDEHLTYKERMNRVEEVIHELGLKKSRDSIIGNPERGIKGLSGGERKRLAFASEVLTNPSLMFCDEPTSGLDSFMAENIVQALKNMAAKGKTVLCTIHQPSSEVFALFDRILLMGEGRVAFLGPAHEAANFFASMSMPCPVNYNPADFYIHTLAIAPGREQECKERCRLVCDSYENSEHAIEIGEFIATNSAAKQSHDVRLSIKTPKSPYKASWLDQFKAVYWRSVISVKRQSALLRVKTFQTILVSTLIALVFQGQTYEHRNVRNFQGALFSLLTNMTFQCMFGVINDITTELPIFLREHFNGMYRTDVYFIGKTLADQPLYIFFPFMFVTIPYFVIGLNPEVTRFLIACGIVTLLANVATSFGYMISCICKSTQVATALGSSLVIPLLLFGGFFLSNSAAPAYLEWLRNMSWFMYANEALSINQWKGVSFNDTNSPCPDHVCTGEYILNQYEFNPEYFYRNIGCLFGLLVGFRLIGFLALLQKTYARN